MKTEDYYDCGMCAVAAAAGLTYEQASMLLKQRVTQTDPATTGITFLTCK